MFRLKTIVLGEYIRFSIVDANCLVLQHWDISSHNADQHLITPPRVSSYLRAKWSGVGVTKPISSIPLFSEFFIIMKTHLSYFHVYIWQVLPQLSCGNTCQIWMWFKESKNTLARSNVLLNAKWTNGALVTPTQEWFQMVMNKMP